MKGRVIARVAVVAVLALLAAGCGSRLSEQEIESAGGGGLGGPAPSSTAPGATAAPDGTPMFGTLASPCGPGDARGATDIGVTDTEIRVVTIADPANTAKPGLNQGVFDSMRAFEQWCNQQGGINGRRLVVEPRDAQLFEYATQVKYACENAFALVGGIGALDDLGAQAQVDCGLPNVPAAAVSALQTGADFTFQPLPNPTDKYNAGTAKWEVEHFPDAVRKAAALRSQLSVTEAQSDRLIEAYEQVGFDFTYVEAAAIGETNWAPLVIAMKNQGVGFVTLTSSFEEIIPLQNEMALQGLEPEVTELETNFYNAKYPEQAGSVADGTFVRLTAFPFEEADRNPATAEYLRALEAAVPGSQPELLGVQAFSAALLWATAAKELGSNLTREGLVEKLSSVHEWNGGGLHGTSDPGNNEPAPCFIVMKVEDGGFVREYPKEDQDPDVYRDGNGFDCSPENIVELRGNYGVGAKAQR
jgi:ABC-type branched-subunit amino acid transport system substrate-binding protein